MKPSPSTTKRRVSAEDALALWREYKATGSLQVRNRLVMTYAPLVKYIVFKKVRELPARCEVEDFISCGLEALIASIDRYDPEKGATLEQFAWTRIHGAVLDELRRQDWAPRSLRRWERDIARARDQFTTLHGRRPERAELADALSICAAARTTSPCPTSRRSTRS
jgi:RNA polymerase sigma factor FliA